MALINEYKTIRDKAFDGQIAKTFAYTLEYVQVVGSVKPAQGLARSGEYPGASLPDENSTKEDFCGVVPYVFEYKGTYDEGDQINILGSGFIYVKVNGGCERSGKVFWCIKGDDKGHFFGAKDENNVELDYARFESKASDGEIVRMFIQLRAGA
jgi:hypothetical protein